MPCHFSGSGRNDVDGQLARLALHDLAARRDDVAQVPLLELAVERFAEPIALDHELDLPRAILQPDETDAAADALDHQTPGNIHGDRLRGERLGAMRLISRE